MDGIKDFFKRLFCKHKFSWRIHANRFFVPCGETHYLVCEKCGKVKDIKFFMYED